MAGLRAVVFDWRGTLVTTLDASGWVREALRRIDRDSSGASVARVWTAITAARGKPSRFNTPGVDSDRALHREVYLGVFADAGLDPELAEALYAVESDAAHNPFAVDAAPTMRALADRGRKIGVLSDIHFDLRPAFAAAGLEGLVDVFVLSYEYGMQKPDPAIFRATLDGLGTDAGQTLMVGDRASHDGAAVRVGMPVLLVPPLVHVTDRRLHHVDALTV